MFLISPIVISIQDFLLPILNCISVIDSSFPVNVPLLQLEHIPPITKFNGTQTTQNKLNRIGTDFLNMILLVVGNLARYITLYIW